MGKSRCFGLQVGLQDVNVIVEPLQILFLDRGDALEYLVGVEDGLGRGEGVGGAGWGLAFDEGEIFDPDPEELFGMFTSYFDAAGGEDHGFIVVSGWVSTLERWERFECDWKLLLARYEIPYFHMRLFSQSKKHFASWEGNEPKRAGFLGLVVEIIKSHVQYGVSGIVEMNSFRKVNKSYELSEAVGCPYSLAGRDCIAHVNNFLRAKNDNKLPAVDYIFDDGDEGKGELIRVVEKDGWSTPIFRPSHDQVNKRGDLLKGVVQLQAADFAAYELRKAFKDDSREEWPIYKYRRSLMGLATIDGEWGKFTEQDLIKICEQVPLRKRAGIGS